MVLIANVMCDSQRQRREPESEYSTPSGTGRSLVFMSRLLPRKPVVRGRLRNQERSGSVSPGRYSLARLGKQGYLGKKVSMVSPGLGLFSWSPGYLLVA